MDNLFFMVAIPYFIGMNLIKTFAVAFVCYVVVGLVSRVPLIQENGFINVANMDER